MPDLANAPLSPLGYASSVTSAFWDADVEPTPELRWPLNIRVFDNMRRQDAQCASVLRAVTLPVRRTGWWIDQEGASDEVTQFVAENLGLSIRGGAELPTPKRMRDRFSWHDHLRQALLEIVFGHMFFEQQYRVSPDGSRALLRKLEPRMPRTIEAINVARDGGLVSIKQYAAGPADDIPQEIPVDRLVCYVNDQEAGDWRGTSLLRAAYKNWLLKDRALRTGSQTLDRNGMGVPVYQGADGENDLTAGLTLARDIRSGSDSGASIPFGASLRLLGVEGALPDSDPFIRYQDEQIARAVLAHFLNLGTQTGSWALGSTFADFFTLSLQTLAQQIADVATQHIVEDLVDVNFGPDEPAPCVVFDEIGSRRDATADAVKALIDAGAISTDEATESYLRNSYGLPPADDTGRQASSPRQLAEMAQKVYLGVGTVLTASEARQILIAAGAEIPVEPAEPLGPSAGPLNPPAPPVAPSNLAPTFQAPTPSAGGQSG